MTGLVLIIGIVIIAIALARANRGQSVAGLPPAVAPSAVRDNFELLAKNIAYCYEALRTVDPGQSDRDCWFGAFWLVTDGLVTSNVTSEASREIEICLALAHQNRDFYDIAVDIIAYEMAETAPHLSRAEVADEVDSHRHRIIAAIRAGQREFHRPSIMAEQATALATDYVARRKRQR